MMLTDLADVLRAGGLTVVETSGWRTRSNDGNRFVAPLGILCHWTATSLAAPGSYPSLNIVTYGRSDLPGMLAQLGLGRDGVWYVIGAGVAWHAGDVDRIESDNYHAIGIEAEYHPAQGAWPEVQQRSYERGCAALARHYGIDLGNVRGHYEAAIPYGRKPDPNTLPGGMAGFRERVKDVLNSNLEEDWMADIREQIITVDGISYSVAQALHLLVAFIQAVAPGTHHDSNGNPELGDIFGAAVFTDNPGTPEERAIRVRDFYTELRERAVADVDEPKLAEELAKLGLTGITPAQVKDAMKAALREGTQS